MSRFALLVLVVALLAPVPSAHAAPTISGPASALPGVDIRVDPPWVIGSGPVSTSPAIQSAGDVNGDGRDDVVVRLVKEGSTAAALYVVFGSSSRAPVQLETIGSRGFYIWGAPSWPLIVRPVGDVTGDGRADLHIVRGTGTGYAHLVFGRTATAPIHLPTMSSQDGRLAPFPGAPAGDVNGDGLTDTFDPEPSDAGVGILLGRPGTTPGPTPAYRIAVRSGSGPCGPGLVPVGDVNGDGRDDLASGGATSSPLSQIDSRACVFYGQSTSTTIDEDSFGALGQGFAINLGYAWQGFAGSYAVPGEARAVGDVDGDGYADLAVSIGWGQLISGRDGSVSIVRGGPYSGLVDARSANRLGVAPEGSSNALAQNMDVFGIPDVTGDGRDEVILGDIEASFSMAGRPLTGTVDLGQLGATGLRVTGATDPAPAGDFDGDGTIDVILGQRIVLTGAL